MQLRQQGQRVVVSLFTIVNDNQKHLSVGRNAGSVYRSVGNHGDPYIFVAMDAESPKK